MTVSNQDNSVSFQGNGVTTVFPYAFLMPTTDDVEVLLYDSTTFTEVAVDSADYSISGIADPAGGSVTYNPSGTPIPSTKWLTIRRTVAYTQTLDLTNQSSFYPTVLEAQLDRIVMQIQQVATLVSEALVLPAGADYTAADILEAALNAAGYSIAAAASAAAAAASAATFTSATAAEMWTGTDNVKFVSSAKIAGLWIKGADIASAATITIPDTGNWFHITGVTGISDIDFTTATNGRVVELYFDGIVTLTHSANLALPGSVNYTTAAGDIIRVRQDNGDAVKVQIFKADGTAVVTSGGATAATQAEQETGSSTIVFVTPGRQQYHASAAKFWAIVTTTGATLSASYNVTSRTDTGLGDLLITIATDFSSTNWVHAMAANGIIVTSASGANSKHVCTGTKAAGTIQLLCFDGGSGAKDPDTSWCVVGFGDQ